MDIHNMSSSLTESKNNLLKGVGNAETARTLLELLMNNSEGFNFKVTVNDNREFYGSLEYVDKYYLFLTKSEERYVGNPPYVRNCGDILIPLKITKSIEIEKSYFDNCYEKLKNM
ncbi:hypothetical protein MKS88_001495 [Plasmodium brasilianum]|uniref:Uncharacterized protein n=2 Tax=Plasmodium (Plasmodium) TaxID=418103 RepID=A0A1A8VTS6_PLAMA|nr:conserved Plasmodium protein, unknown function [Plasmodium malariae]KAI4840137.1 hypothetical protein MKS88_001495 [Plasmodium brasilianum]SBS83076.1 conserved Plasmodium protein, unknown function [Plasmodium malariae]SBT87497.1 conserved Plasmodium protein, unknown function [Plasmodium malariae]